MVAAKKARVTKEAGQLRRFLCPHCGYTTSAHVVGVGHGREGVHVLDDDGAASCSDRLAAEAARTNATLTLSLARCPSCHKRSTANVRAFWLCYGSVVLAGVGLLWTLGGLVYRFEGHDAALWCAGPLGLLAGGLIAWMESWKWTTVDQRVVFVER